MIEIFLLSIQVFCHHHRYYLSENLRFQENENIFSILKAECDSDSDNASFKAMK